MSILGSVFRDLMQLRADASAARPEQRDERQRIFIGYDPRQAVAYNVLQYSLFTRSSQPLSITPLVIETLPIGRQGLTPFTYTRFLVPWLCNYEGWGLFLDLDMLALGDIAEVFELADPRYAVMVIKSTERFEWASSILFNCAHPANAILTPDYVDDPERCRAPHVMDWLDEELVGSLPREWNHTVGYDAPRNDAKLVHYTQGVPCHPETQGCEYTQVWMDELSRLGDTQSWTELMGTSVHAKALSDGRVVPKLHQEGGGETEIPDAAGRSDSAKPRGNRSAASPRFQELVGLYKEMHQHGDRLNEIPADQTFDGRSLFPHLDAIAELSKRFGAKSLLDYGCGKGSAYSGSFTLPDGRTVSSMESLWGVDEIRLYDPGFEPFSEVPSETFDGVISTDVLEHCPEEDLDWIVDEMFSFAKSFLFCTISCRPAVKQLPTGENAHITIKPPEWWKKKFESIGRDHPGVTYVAVCYGHDDTPVVLEN